MYARPRLTGTWALEVVRGARRAAARIASGAGSASCGKYALRPRPCCEQGVGERGTLIPDPAIDSRVQDVMPSPNWPAAQTQMAVVLLHDADAKQRLYVTWTLRMKKKRGG